MEVTADRRLCVWFLIVCVSSPVRCQFALFPVGRMSPPSHTAHSPSGACKPYFKGFIGVSTLKANENSRNDAHINATDTSRATPQHTRAAAYNDTNVGQPGTGNLPMSSVKAEASRTSTGICNDLLTYTKCSFNTSTSLKGILRDKNSQRTCSQQQCDASPQNTARTQCRTRSSTLLGPSPPPFG